MTSPPGDRVPGHDLRLVPVAVAGWIGAWLGVGLSAPTAVIGTVGAVALATAAALRRSTATAALAVILTACLVGGALAQHRLQSGPVGTLAGERAVGSAELVVRHDPQPGLHSRTRSPYLTVRAEVRRLEARGSAWRVRVPVLVVVSGPEAVTRWSTVPVGTRVRSFGRLDLPEGSADVAALLRVREPPAVVRSPGAGLRVVERIRHGLRTAVAARPPEPRALVPALVLGDTSAMTPELVAEFRSTGLSHLTAVSGANLTLLLAFLLIASRWLGVRGWWLRGMGLFGVVVFVALCRTEPSVLRASAMGLVALAALGVGGGSRRGLRHLAVAVVGLLLLDPFLARSVGFALSVLASGGIVWWASTWTTSMGWLPRPLAESVAVPLAAHLATLPVVAAISGAVSVAGVLANMLAGPFVGPATVLGFLAAFLSLLSPTLAAAAGWAASWCAQMIIWVAQAGSVLPGASWRWPVSGLSLGVLAGASLLIGTGLGAVLSRRWLAGSLGLLMIAGLLTGPVQPGWPPRNWVLVACDVGQGDGLVVRVGQHQGLLVDAGPDPVAIGRCLSRLRLRSLPVVVLTHFHADHVDGLPGVLQTSRVGEIWVSPSTSPATQSVAIRDLAAVAGIRVRSPPLGERGAVADVVWEVLGPVAGSTPPSEAGPESGAENDSSLVLRVTVQGVRLLLTGDVEPAGQQRILATGADLHADVVKLPHHGSARQDPAFLQSTRAQVAIASAGQDNDYGHPAPKTVSLVESLGMVVLRTDEHGAVAITVRDGRLGAVTQR